MKQIYIVMCRYNHNSGESEIEGCYTDKKMADDYAKELTISHGEDAFYKFIVEEYTLNENP